MWGDELWAVTDYIMEVFYMDKIKDNSEKKNKLPEMAASVGMAFAKLGANAGCCLIFHQPEKPDLKKLRKF